MRRARGNLGTTLVAELPQALGRALVDEFAAHLIADAPPVPHPERTARNVVLRLMRQTLLQLELRGEPPTAIAPDLVVFAPTPYLGLREARRWALAPR